MDTIKSYIRRIPLVKKWRQYWYDTKVAWAQEILKNQIAALNNYVEWLHEELDDMEDELYGGKS